MTEQPEQRHEVEMRIRSESPSELFVTRTEINLMLKELTSRMTLLILGSVALNQFLSATAVPSVVGAAVSGVVALGFFGKILSVLFLR